MQLLQDQSHIHKSAAVLLQNKLHRNAGPEDLVATEAVLKRITAPGAEYSQDFVKEFQIFTAELRDFFNAGSFADMLGALKESFDESASQVQNSVLLSLGFGVRLSAAFPSITLLCIFHHKCS